MNVSNKLDFELDDLTVDVFDLDGTGLTIESLTAGHGGTELSASFCSCSIQGSCGCGCSCTQQD